MQCSSTAKLLYFIFTYVFCWKTTRVSPIVCMVGKSKKKKKWCSCLIFKANKQSHFKFDYLKVSSQSDKGLPPEEYTFIAPLSWYSFLNCRIYMCHKISKRYLKIIERDRNRLRCGYLMSIQHKYTVSDHCKIQFNASPSKIKENIVFCFQLKWLQANNKQVFS